MSRLFCLTLFKNIDLCEIMIYVKSPLHLIGILIKVWGNEARNDAYIYKILIVPNLFFKYIYIKYKIRLQLNSFALSPKSENLCLMFLYLWPLALLHF